MVNDRKQILKDQIIKSLKNEERKLMFNFDMRYEKLIKGAENKKISNEKKKNQIFSTLKMKGYKNSLLEILDNNNSLLNPEQKQQNNENTFKVKKIQKNKSADILLKKLYSNRKKNNKVKLKIIKNIINKIPINLNNNENNVPVQSMQNSAATSKYTFFKKNNNTRNSKNNIHFFNTGESFFAKFKKRKASNYSMDKIIKTSKYSCEKSQSKMNFEISKTIDNSPNIKNNKENNQFMLNNFGNNMIEINFFGYKERVNKYDYETIDLPDLFAKRNMKRTNSGYKSTIKRNLSNYKNFYNFFNHDKNYFVGTEFHEPIIKGYKYLKDKKSFENYKGNK